MKKILKVFSLIFALTIILSSCGTKTEKETYIYQNESGKQIMEFSFRDNKVEKLSSTVTSVINKEDRITFEMMEKMLEEFSKEDGIDVKTKINDNSGEFTVSIDFSKINSDRVNELTNEVDGKFSFLSSLFMYKGKDKEFVKSKMEEFGFIKK